MRNKDRANSRATSLRKEKEKLERKVKKQKAQIDQFNAKQAAKDDEVEHWALDAPKALLEKEELEDVVKILRGELSDMQVGAMKILAPRKRTEACSSELVEFGMRLMLEQ